MTTVDDALNKGIVAREEIHHQYECSLIWHCAMMVSYFLEAILRELRNIEYELVKTRGKIG